MRYFHKSWQDKRPTPTRRVRWYQGEDDIRLQFEDEFGVINAVFSDEEAAQTTYDSFKDAEVDTNDIRERFYPEPARKDPF